MFFVDKQVYCNYRKSMYYLRMLHIVPIIILVNIMQMKVRSRISYKYLPNQTQSKVKDTQVRPRWLSG